MENQCKDKAMEMVPKENGLYGMWSPRKNIQMQTLWCSEQLCASELFTCVTEAKLTHKYMSLCLYICRYGVLRQVYLEVASAIIPNLVIQASLFLLVFLTVHWKTNRDNSCHSLKSRQRIFATSKP